MPASPDRRHFILRRRPPRRPLPPIAHQVAAVLIGIPVFWILTVGALGLPG